MRNESLHEWTNLGRLQCLRLTIPLPTPWPIQDQYSNLKRWSKVLRNRAVISIIFVSKWAFLDSKQFWGRGAGVESFRDTLNSLVSGHPVPYMHDQTGR